MIDQGGVKKCCACFCQIPLLASVHALTFLKSLWSFSLSCENTLIFWSFCHLLCPSNTHSLSFVFFSSRRDDWSGWRDRQSEYRVLHGRGLTANTAGAHAQTHALVSIADDGRALRLSSEDSSRVWVWVHVSWHAVITKVIPTGLLGMPSVCVCVCPCRTGPGVACQDGSDLRGSQAILCARVCQERSPDCQVRRAWEMITRWWWCQCVCWVYSAVRLVRAHAKHTLTHSCSFCDGRMCCGFSHGPSRVIIVN